MGKNASKTAGGGWRTRRQRSQSIAEPSVVSSPEPPRIVAESTDRAIHTLKLQRDELTVYKGRVNTLLKKEDETVKRLLKEGKTDRAKLLLKKKRFQENILQETETQLNAILNQANTDAALPELKQEVDDSIDRNSEAMKKLHILLSLENAEWMLQETYEGTKKQSEINQLLQLATLAERDDLEKDVETEIHKLEVALGLVPEDKEEAELLASPPTENAVPDVISKEDQNELEALVVEKLKEKDIVAVTLAAPEVPAPIETAQKVDDKEPEAMITQQLDDAPDRIVPDGENAAQNEEATEQEEEVAHKARMAQLFAQRTTESIDLVRKRDEVHLDGLVIQKNQDESVKVEFKLEQQLGGTEIQEFTQGPFGIEISGTTVVPIMTVENGSYDKVVPTFSDVTTSGFTILGDKVWSSTNVSEAPLNQKSTEIVGLLPDVPSHSIDMNNDSGIVVKEAPEKSDFIGLADEDVL